MMTSSLIHVPTKDMISFLCMAAQYSMVCMYHILFVKSVIDGHLGWFHVFPIVNSAAIKIRVRVGSQVSESAGRSAGQGSLGPNAMSWNLRTALIFGSFISLIGAAFYPIYFRPLMRLEDYRREQTINRAGIVQEDVQTPGLKVWSDPFGRK
ncbi:uncharacterized protein [Macaca nemestrina]|uniref:uncharacterized protein n=1 Tax=Macaca nemestrina TaxID=9545 RepID=UPI0039B8BEAF